MSKKTNSNDISIFLGLGSSLLSDIGNYEEAVDMFKMAADIGNPEAQYKLAYMYRKGLGCEKKEDEADKLFTLSFRRYSELANYDSKAQYYISLMYFNGYGIPKDDEMAFKYCEKSVRNGYQDALLDLGKMYVEGIGTKNNYKKGFDCFKKSVENNNIEAKYSLGLMYKLGIGVRQDEKIADTLLKESFKYYKQREENEADFIQLHLAFMYLEGLGTKKDYKKAIKCYKKLAKNGDSNAQFLVGLFYYYGLFDSKQDYNKAIKWFKKSAKQGKIEAELIIADMYLEGNGFIQNYKKAFNCYFKLAQKGNLEAKCNIWFMHELGLIEQEIDNLTIDRYFEQIQFGYKKKSKEGFNYANLRLACINVVSFMKIVCLYKCKVLAYFFDINCSYNFFNSGLNCMYYYLRFYENFWKTDKFEKNRIVKYLYSNITYLSYESILDDFKNIYKCKKINYSDIEQIVNALCLIFFKNKKNDSYQGSFDAVEYLKEKAEQGNLFLQYILGCMYLEGKGVEKDKTKAFELFYKSAEFGYLPAKVNDFESLRKLAEQESAQAQYELGYRYSEGKGVEQDYSKAFEWYSKSAEQGFAQAQYELAGMYYNGIGIEQDKTKAFELLNKSARQGNINAKCRLNELYFIEKKDIKLLENCVNICLPFIKRYILPFFHFFYVFFVGFGHFMKEYISSLFSLLIFIFRMFIIIPFFIFKNFKSYKWNFLSLFKSFDIFLPMAKLYERFLKD